MTTEDVAPTKVRLGALMFALMGLLGLLAPLAPHRGHYDLTLILAPSLASIVIELVAWDPSAAHAGTAVDRRPWTAHLMVIEVGNLTALAGDDEAGLLVDVAFPEPVISDLALASSFLRLHAALETPTTRLERDEQLAEWLRAMIHRAPRRPPTTTTPQRPRQQSPTRRLRLPRRTARTQHQPQRARPRRWNRQIPPHPPVPPKNWPATPRPTSRPPHPRRPTAARSRPHNSRDRRRQRLR